MEKFFRLPFGVSGDLTTVPDALQTSGGVSYETGYTYDYQRDSSTDPLAKNIERDKMNYIMYAVTKAVQEMQANGVPDFITPALNGGHAYIYSKGARVKDSGRIYESLKAANTDSLAVAASWALVDVPGMQSASYLAAAAGGTADAITATFVPAIAAYSHGMTLFVRAASANTTTTPTINVNWLGALTVVKGANFPLVAGDISGAGHWLELQIDTTLNKAVLQNPASGVTTRGVRRFTWSGSFTVPAGVSTIYISGCGGGGGGGGGGGSTASASSYGSGGGGGAAGQSQERIPYAVTPGQEIPMIIGGAGSPGAGASGSGAVGTAGGATFVGTLVALAGGGGGGGGGSITSGFIAGGAGGAGYPDGSCGSDGQANVPGSMGGAGGSSPFGGGGGASRGAFGVGMTGSAGIGFGGGGGGGGGSYVINSGSGGNGGVGAQGFVIIEW